MTANQLSGFVASDGLQIFYQQFGDPAVDGAPLILVHGWGSESHGNWIDTGWVEVLGLHRTLVAIDVRGHGKSDKPHALEPYSYANMSSDVLAVMDSLEIERGDFMGYSMGSFMGAWLLGHHPERFTSMVLGGLGDETPESAAQGEVIANALRAVDVAAVDSPMGRGVRQYVEQNPHNDRLALACSAEKMWPEGYPLRIAGSNIGAAQFPVLVVNGEDDHPYVDTADHFVQALPDGKHVRISGVDHMSVVADNRFKALALEFLQAH